MTRVPRIERPVEVHYKTQKRPKVERRMGKRPPEELEDLNFKNDRVTLGSAPEIPTYDRTGRPAGARIAEDIRSKVRKILDRE